jgi:acetyltransferase EpsM
MDIYIIGCGGNAKVVVDICELNKYNVVGFFDDKFVSEEQIYHKYKIVGKICDVVHHPGCNIVNSIGDCKTRQKIFDELRSLQLNWVNCIHPNSYISKTAKIGKGNIICCGSFINCDAKLGDFNLVNTHSVIEHDCRLGNFNHIGPSSTLCGSIQVGNTNLFGAGTTVIPGKIIGNFNIIGAMSAVINDINDNCTVVGIPAKVIKQNTCAP